MSGNWKTSLQRLLAVLASLVLIGVLLGGGAAYWWLGRPYSGFGSETYVEIEHGMSSRAIGRKLAQQGVIRSAYAFLALRFLHPAAALQAGEYRFESAETPFAVFDKIRRGDIFYEEVTVPEGSNMFDIEQLLQPLHAVAVKSFLTAAGKPNLVADLDAQALTAEGFLFPSTYRITRKTTGEQLCRMMVAEFRRQWHTLSAGDQAADVHHVVTLASLVEKETGLSSERPLVAAVFANRLQRNMPLQCDPTTVYAALLEKRYRGTIHRSDLASTNPYNTYAHTGLPPGPIANPGIASLRAALVPVQTDFLYFVAKADGSGGHNFSATLDAHERAVLAYRKELQAHQ